MSDQKPAREEPLYESDNGLWRANPKSDSKPAFIMFFLTINRQVTMRDISVDDLVNPVKLPYSRHGRSHQNKHSPAMGCTTEDALCIPGTETD